ncbi:uncharacterized protein LOC114310731 [Camellia sinensis]|uniref:uncharacterized protein LOC114310731 n=1 Tax=Camellia sinensis TaxID=4442 RepID=UPI001035AD3F|nr:uncharacterized protein LOC114310731 [Camellia sinensis]
MDLFEAFVALQEVVSSINYVCGVYIIVLHVALERYQSRLDMKRSPHPFQAQLDYLNRLVKDSNIDCHEQLRVNRRMCLCTLVRSVGLSDSKYVLLEEKVAMFLNVISHDYKNRNTKFNFMQSRQTNCLGALDETYVRVHVPTIDKPRYRTWKGEIVSNVLGVCSQDMQFIYVLPRWEGSTSDFRVLRDVVDKSNGLKVPTGFYYLVDASYTNDEGFLVPYKGQRYHLSTWREWGIPMNPEEFFNLKHSVACNVLERCFGLLKIRWAILRTASYYPIKAQGHIITTCCLLHNLIRREMPVDPFEFELNNTPLPQPDLGEEFINTVEPSNQWSMDSVATNRSRKKSKGKADAGSIGSRHVQRQPSVSSMQNKSFPYYEDWLVLFGKDRATGELAEDPVDAVEAIAVEEAMGEKGDGSPAK